MRLMKLNYLSLIQYGILALPVAFAGLPIYIHAPEFYASQYGTSLTALGILLLLIRLFDAFQDPFIGYFCDQYQESRLKIILLGVILLLSGFIALFYPLKETSSILVWFTISLFLATLGYSILAINLNTLGALLSQSTHENTRIVAYRERFGLIGLLLATLIPSILMIKYTPSHSFSLVSAILLVLMCISLISFIPWYLKTTFIETGVRQLKRSKQHYPKESKNFILEMVGKFRSMPEETAKLYTVFAVSTLASSIPAVLIIFFINDRLNLSNFTGLFLTVYFVSAGIGLSFWQKLSERIGKPAAWGCSMLLAIAVFIWALFLNSGDLMGYLCICLLSGVAFGAELILPFSMMADQIQRRFGDQKLSDTDKTTPSTPQNSETFSFSILTLLMKMSLALSAGITLPFLDIWGYMPGQLNSEHALQALSFAYAVIPTVLKSLAFIMLWRFKDSLLINLQVAQKG